MIEMQDVSSVEHRVDYGVLKNGQRARNGEGHPPTMKELFDKMPENIVSEIAAKDTMYTPTEEQIWPHYAMVGQSALQCVRLALLAAGKDDCRNILDLPCGHGRVMRVLRGAFPRARITACDLDNDGVDFCARAFGAIPVYSADKPADIPIKDQFDLIYCGSLLTHVNQGLWHEFLRFFSSVLAPGGIFLFTTQGRESVRWLRTGKFDYHLGDIRAILREYDAYGFGYQPYPGGHFVNNFGVALSSPEWVMRQVARLPELRIINFTERGLDNHQDVVTCVRE